MRAIGRLLTPCGGGGEATFQRQTWDSERREFIDHGEPVTVENAFDTPLPEGTRGAIDSHGSRWFLTTAEL